MARVKCLRPRLAPPRVGTGTWASDEVRGNRHQRGYGTEWDRRRKRILARDDGLCQPCLGRDLITMATQVDHIVQKASGGSEEDENLQSICGDCHKAKTARESLR